VRSPQPVFSVDPTNPVPVDPTNPGQFFACCGLLELGHRLWPDAEGWFDADATGFHVVSSAAGAVPLEAIVKKMVEVEIEGELSRQEQTELNHLELRKREVAREGGKLQESEEARRSFLGKRRREGALTLPEPFRLRLAWWQEEGDDIPKTFAGRQEVLRMARAMLAKLPEAVQSDQPLKYRCLLQAVGKAPPENDPQGSRSRGEGSKVEPFYFDACRFAHSLDVGFSLDVQQQALRATAAPLTELLALVGLQRFRPALADGRWVFEYSTWGVPLSPVAAAAVVCGAASAPGGRRYRFPLRFRDDQKRYKAFGFATPIGGRP